MCFLKWTADNRLASVVIEIAHADTEIQELYFEQFVQLKSMLHKYYRRMDMGLLHTG